MTPETLKAWRARLTLSEHAMAAYLGVPLGTLRKWENGQPVRCRCRAEGVFPSD